MIRLSPEAEADLQDIATWIKRDDTPSVAVRIHDRIVDALRPLDLFPLAGRVGRMSGTRELSVAGSPYIAVYQPHDDGVLVLRIIHGAMNWPHNDD